MSDFQTIDNEEIEQNELVSDVATLNTSVLNINNKLNMTTSSAMKTAIDLNTAKTGITGQQASDITTNNAKVGITTDQANAINANTAKVGITTSQANAINANTLKTGITTQQALDIQANNLKTGITNTQASNITSNNTTTTNFGNLINNTLSCALKSSLDTNTSNISGILNNSLSSNLKTAVDTNSAKISFPSTLNSLLSVTDTYELEVGSGSGIPRIRLNGANGNTTSSEIIFIDATGNAEEYFQGFTLRYNSADNIFQILSDQANNNSPLEALKIDRSSRETQMLKACVYLNEIEAKGGSGITPSNANLMLTTKQGSLPGYSTSYYPTVKTSYSNMYFAVGGNYVGYLTSSSVGQIDFTAQHKAVPVNNNLINNLSNNIGKIVISNGEICSLIEDSSGIFQPTTGKAGITINEAIPKVLLSNKYKDKRIFGVISDGLDNETNGEKHYKVGAFTSVIHSDENDNRLFINSGGEGAILVTDICGNIENGDLITTSVVEGIGCKQDDDLIHSYTIAKSTINCDFDLNSNNYNCYIDENNNKIAFISCIYLL